MQTIDSYRDGVIEGTHNDFGKPIRYSADLDLEILSICRGLVNFEDLADGFGAGLGTEGDWSAIRDSSRPAKNAMLARSLAVLREVVDAEIRRETRHLS